MSPIPIVVTAQPLIVGFGTVIGTMLVVCGVILTIVLCGCGNKENEEPVQQPMDEKQQPETPVEEPKEPAAPETTPEEPKEKSAKQEAKSQVTPSGATTVMQNDGDLQLMSKLGGEQTLRAVKKVEASKQPSFRLTGDSMVQGSKTPVKVTATTTKSVSMMSTKSKKK